MKKESAKFFRNVKGFLSKKLFLFMYLNVLPAVCIYTACVPGAQEGQKSVLDPPELEFKMVMSCHMGAGYKFRSSERADSAPNC